MKRGKIRGFANQENRKVCATFQLKLITRGFLVFLALLKDSTVNCSYPPPGKCSYYVLSSTKTFTGVTNDPQAVQQTNLCPQSESSFRVAMIGKLTANVPPGESAILFAYHNIIQIFVKRDGAGHKIEVFKVGETNGGLLFSEPMGKLNWQFFIFLQITPTEAHFALRSWKYFAHENHRKWKKSFSKPAQFMFSLIFSQKTAFFQFSKKF